MPDEPIKLLLLKNEAFQPVYKTNIWWIYSMCDNWSVFQTLSIDWISRNWHIKTIITSHSFVRQLIVPGNYLDIRIVKPCPLLIIITLTNNLNSYTKKPKCLKQYLSQYSLNAGQRFEWCDNDMNDFYHQNITHTNVWHSFCRIK